MNIELFEGMTYPLFCVDEIIIHFAVRDTAINGNVSETWGSHGGGALDINLLGLQAM